MPNTSNLAVNPEVGNDPVMILATLPFSGFYDSLHDAEIDQATEQMFSDVETGCHRNEGLESALFNKCDFGAVHVSYATDYAGAFADEFKIQGLKFESLKSPKEYNFSTDVIFVQVPASEVARILAATDGKALADLVTEKFSHRSGFVSFYSPDLADWGPVEKWDHNQVGTLLEAYANQETTDVFDSSAEVALMEKARSNGYIDGWIESATPGIERLYKIHDYLNARMARGKNNMPIKPFINGHWHAWQGTPWKGSSPVMLSNEETKELQEFETPDTCINWLFVNGHKEAARALNAHIKGSN